MNRVTWAIFPGVLVGSAIVALIAMLVTSGSTFQAHMVQSALAAAQPIAAQAATEIPAMEDAVGCLVSEGYPASIRQWCDLISVYSEKNGLDSNLIAALILQESGGDPSAYSHSGAVGLMQVMPRDGIAASFQCNAGPCFASRPTIQELEDPEYNISYGTQMLAGLVAKRGSVRDALMAYGPANVGYYYADIVLAIYEQY